jgi:peptide/nickel transport system permease protein
MVIRRLLVMVPIVWIVLTATFIVLQTVPGSYADVVENPRLTPEARQEMRARYGLDTPPLEQYFKWLKLTLAGDLGASFMYKEPVARVLLRALPPTLLLSGSALLLMLIGGTALAMAGVRRPNGAADRITSVLGLIIYGMPSFWLAGLLILIFSLGLGWFPASHMRSVDAASLGAAARTVDLIRHLALPALCLGLVGAAGAARYLRATLLDIRSSQFILAARARGIPERRILWVHTLRPALLPVVTLFGLALPLLASGSVVIETIFSWPGLGQVFYNAARARDIPLVLGGTLLATAVVLVGNLLADVLYAVVDPRVREDRR